MPTTLQLPLPIHKLVPVLSLTQLNKQVSHSPREIICQAIKSRLIGVIPSKAVWPTWCSILLCFPYFFHLLNSLNYSPLFLKMLIMLQSKCLAT